MENYSMRQSLRLSAIALVMANAGFLAAAKPADAQLLSFSKATVTLNFRPELLAKAKGLAVGAGLTLPAAIANASPTVKLTGKATIDTTSKSATVTIDQKVAVTVRGITVSGKNCLINSVSSSSAVLSCVLEASPVVAARRVPLIKFTGNTASLALGATAKMEVPPELAAVVNQVAKKQILTPGLLLGTASGTAQL
jgi:hypothetical protein